MRAARGLGWGNGSGHADTPLMPPEYSWEIGPGGVPDSAPAPVTGRSHGPAQTGPGGWPSPVAQAGAVAGPVVPSAPDGLAAVNTEGRICAQIMVIGESWTPFTDGPLVGVQDIVRWLDSWQVPRTWPAGRPPPFQVAAGATQQTRRNWARGGHFGASQVPGSAAPARAPSIPSG